MAVSIEQRVARAADAMVQARGYVSPIDVLVAMGWLQPVHREQWQQGRVPCLEQLVQVNPSKITGAVRALEQWAREQGLEPRETAYVARTLDRRTLQFSAVGDPSVERAYSTHWVSPALSESERARVVERAGKPPDLVVVAPLRDWTCAGCGGTGDLLLMEDDAPLCLACADLDHLTYLPAGDPALTRRAKKASRLSAVVVRFSRARKRYERQGVLIEEHSLADAEASCLADAEARERRRGRDEERRRDADSQFVAQLTQEIGRLFPGCPSERADAIAAHAAVRDSGRIGRTAAGQRLDEQAVELAVIASIRHRETDYDSLLMAGVPRAEARARVRGDVDATLARWRSGC